MTGYCVKCKAVREMSNVVKASTKKGRAAMRGACATCGTKMFKILGKSATAASAVVTREPQAWGWTMFG